MYITLFSRIGLLFTLWIFLHCLWVTYDGLQPFKGKADIAIVLGNTVNEDGTLSPWLQGRVDAALNLYRKKEIKKIFVSGGITPGIKPEGDAMKDYLVAKGVPQAAVISDNYGQNTYLTARHFLALDSIEQYQSAVVVTSFYHIPRSKYIIKKLGYKHVYGDYSRAFFSVHDWYSMIRDCVGFYKYWLAY